MLDKKWKKWAALGTGVLIAILGSGILDKTVTAWDNDLVALAVSILGVLGAGAGVRAVKAKAAKSAAAKKLSATFRPPGP